MNDTMEKAYEHHEAWVKFMDDHGLCPDHVHDTAELYSAFCEWEARSLPRQIPAETPPKPGQRVAVRLDFVDSDYFGIGYVSADDGQWIDDNTAKPFTHAGWTVVAWTPLPE